MHKLISDVCTENGVFKIKHSQKTEREASGQPIREGLQRANEGEVNNGIDEELVMWMFSVNRWSMAL